MSIEFTEINNDAYGNPRVVCHFLNFIKDGEKANYDLAAKRANKLGGRKYNNRHYGGGIAFQHKDLKKLEQQIIDSLK